MIAFADYEENKSLIEQEVNAYIVERLRGALATLEDHTNGKHHRLLLHAASPTPTPSVQAEYWPTGQDA